MTDNLFRAAKDAGLVEAAARFKTFGSYKSQTPGVFRTISIYNTELDDLLYIYDNKTQTLLKYDPSSIADISDVSVVDENFLSEMSLKYKVTNYAEELFRQEWKDKNPNATPMKLVPLGWLEQIPMLALVSELKRLNYGQVAEILNTTHSDEKAAVLELS